MKTILSLMLLLAAQSAFAGNGGQQVINEAHKRGLKGCDQAINQKFEYDNFSRIETHLANDNLSGVDGEGNRTKPTVVLFDASEEGSTYTSMKSWMIKKTGKQCVITMFFEMRAYPNISCRQMVADNSLVINEQTGSVIWTKESWNKEAESSIKLLSMGNGCAQLHTPNGLTTNYYDKD